MEISKNTTEEAQVISEFLQTSCSYAKQVGDQIDLTGCCYGEPHWEGDFVTTTSPYYYFLAGMVRVFEANRILEIGTHYGGSMRSMMRGVKDDEHLANGCFVTADISYKNPEGFLEYPDTLITRVQGDAASDPTAQIILDAFGEEPIDILYIDATHTFEGTVVHINIFAEKLNPRLIILDDIHLNEGMQRLWAELQNSFGFRAFDVTGYARRGESGFGVLLLRH